MRVRASLVRQTVGAQARARNVRGWPACGADRKGDVAPGVVHLRQNPESPRGAGPLPQGSGPGDFAFNPPKTRGKTPAPARIVRTLRTRNGAVREHAHKVIHDLSPTRMVRRMTVGPRPFSFNARKVCRGPRTGK